MEQCDEYVQANHAKLPAINDEEFLSKTRVLVALNKAGSYYLKKEFCKELRQILEEFTNSAISTVAARSSIGQALNLRS